jgi:CBS domain-containing protein
MTAVKASPSVADVMTRDPICVTPEMGIRELARTFRDNEISGAPVVNQQGTLVGVITKTDLLRRCADGFADIAPAYLFEVLYDQAGEDEPESGEFTPEPTACVEDFMTEDPLTVSPRTPVATIARQMFDRRIHRVIVVDRENFPVGIVTSLDLLGAFPAPYGIPT